MRKGVERVLSRVRAACCSKEGGVLLNKSASWFATYKKPRVTRWMGTTLAVVLFVVFWVALGDDADIQRQWSEHKGGPGHNVKQDGDSLVEINQKWKQKESQGARLRVHLTLGY